MTEVPSSHNRNLLPALAVAICGAMWGVLWFPLRWIDAQGVGGGWATFCFNLITVLAPLPWMLRPAAWKGFASQAVTGLLLGAAFALYTASLVLTDVLHAILLFYLTPVWSTLATWLVLGERLTSSRLLAMGLGFAGIACILGTGGGLPLPRNSGDWIALASGLLWTAGTIRSFRRPSLAIALPVFAFGAGGLMASAIILMLAAAAGLPLAQAGGLTGNWPSVVLIALVLFVPPNALVLWAAQRLDPGRVGILLMTEVMAGAASAALLSGEPFGWPELAGTALIIGAGLAEISGRG